jgi:hypothetical protein
MKNYCDICFKCNDTETCYTCDQFDVCMKFKDCFGHIPSKMWGEMTSFDDIMRCVEKWRVYNEQTVKQ